MQRLRSSRRISDSRVVERTSATSIRPHVALGGSAEPGQNGQVGGLRGSGRRGRGTKGASVRDRGTGPRGHLRDRVRRAGHHVHVLGHPQLCLRGSGLLHRPLLLLPPHPAGLGHLGGRRRVHRDRLSSARSAALRGLLPLPPTGLAPDQGGGDDRPLGRPPLPGRVDLRQPGHPVGPGPGSRARPRLQLSGRAGHARPGHRLHLRRRHRRGRSPGAALHRRGPQGQGHGRLAGDDRPVRHQSGRGVDRGLGGQYVLRRPGRRTRRSGDRTGRRQLHPAHRGHVRGRHRGQAPQSARGGRSGAAHGYRHLGHPALPSAGQPVDQRDHRCRSVHRHRPGAPLQPDPSGQHRRERRVGRGPRPGHRAPGRESTGRFHHQRGRIGLPQPGQPVRRSGGPHRRRRRAAPDPRRVLGRLGRPGLRLRRDLPLVDAGDR